MTGQLHIFFGAAPGVGKTWAMVDAAQQKRAEGQDVVIGWVDTHDRPEFSGLLEGLEVLPPQEIEYQGVTLRELNLNAILQRHPDIVLIDELAHSNVPGARHAKRYQDVVELLQAKISVFTTLSVQNVASIADAVAQLTGVETREQVPDFVLEMASSIRLIDLAPEELLNRLLKRLKSDKGEMPDLFKPSNLVTLRELALRVAAARVDDDMRKLADPALSEPWGTSSRVMIGVSASPNNERLIQATARLVKEMHTTWLAVYVQTPGHNDLSDDERAQIERHLQQAKDLGAETLTVAGKKAAEQLVQVAKQYGVSRIVVGRSKQRGFLGRHHSLAEEIMELDDDIDVLILSG
jgi:two-component system, OmpR family, sensor histidine kinase KdpD